jgi:hypothetical protein
MKWQESTFCWGFVDDLSPRCFFQQRVVTSSLAEFETPPRAADLAASSAPSDASRCPEGVENVARTTGSPSHQSLLNDAISNLIGLAVACGDEKDPEVESARRGDRGRNRLAQRHRVAHARERSPSHPR